MQHRFKLLPNECGLQSCIHPFVHQSDHPPTSPTFWPFYQYSSNSCWGQGACRYHGSATTLLPPTMANTNCCSRGPTDARLVSGPPVILMPSLQMRTLRPGSNDLEGPPYLGAMSLSAVG